MNDRFADALEKLGVADHIGNKTEAPLKHYRALFAAADPAQLAARSNVPFNAEDSVFELAVFGQPVDVLWPEMGVVMAANGAAVPPSIQILAARVILEGSLVPATGIFKAYAEMPWGEAYLDAFNRRCIKPLSCGFDDVDDFSDSCQRMGFAAIAGGDAAYEAEFMPGLFLHVLYWEADDEFPAAAQVVFSDNFPLAFSAEDMAAIGDVLVALLVG